MGRRSGPPPGYAGRGCGCSVTGLNGTGTPVCADRDRWKNKTTRSSLFYRSAAVSPRFLSSGFLGVDVLLLAAGEVTPTCKAQPSSLCWPPWLCPRPCSGGFPLWKNRGVGICPLNLPRPSAVA